MTFWKQCALECHLSNVGEVFWKLSSGVLININLYFFFYIHNDLKNDTILLHKKLLNARTILRTILFKEKFELCILNSDVWKYDESIFETIVSELHEKILEKYCFIVEKMVS